MTSDEVGNDGLTDPERAEYARRWRDGAGKTPSKEQMRHLRALGEAVRSGQPTLHLEAAAGDPQERIAAMLAPSAVPPVPAASAEEDAVLLAHWLAEPGARPTEEEGRRWADCTRRGLLPVRQMSTASADDIGQRRDDAAATPTGVRRAARWAAAMIRRGRL